MLAFRTTVEADLHAIITMEQRYLAYVGQWTKEQHLASMNDKNAVHFTFFDESCPVSGYAILRGLDTKSRSIELMRIALDTPGQGMGKEALRLLLKWCFEARHAHRVWLDVRLANQRALHVYKSMGFCEEGTLRDAVLLDDGTYESLIILSMLENEYHRLAGKVQHI